MQVIWKEHTTLLQHRSMFLSSSLIKRQFTLVWSNNLYNTLKNIHSLDISSIEIIFQFHSYYKWQDKT